MQTSVYINSENHHLLPELFNIGILQQMFKISAVCRNTTMETLTPLLDSVVDDALVYALLRSHSSVMRCRNSSGVRIFSLYTRYWSTPHIG